MSPPPKPSLPNQGKEEEPSDMGAGMLIPDSNELMQQSLCEKHFPEPIIYMGPDMQPLCKKCIPEQMDRLKSKMPSGGQDTQAMANVANLLGFGLPSQQNLYQSENKLIQRYMLKLDDFYRDMRFLHDEVQDRT